MTLHKEGEGVGLSVGGDHGSNPDGGRINFYL